MEKSKPFVLLGLAIIIALVTSVLIYNWLRHQKAPTAQEKFAMDTVPVVVAARDLSWGTLLTEDMVKRTEILKIVPLNKANLPVGSFSDPLLLKNRVLVASLQLNEPILESRLAPVGASAGVGALISPKKRAMAVRVDKVIGVAGFVYPNNRVDVLVTLTLDNKPTTKLVLENILVLATGTETERKEEGKKPSLVDVITLELTPEEAEMLALAATEGRLQLALRGFGDTETVLTRGKSIPSLMASYSSLGTITGGKVAPRKVRIASGITRVKEKTTVIIIKGGVASTATF